MFKKRLKQLGQEQEDLFLTPSDTTPVRLAEIAEEKRLIGEIFATCGYDSPMIKGFLKGRFTKLMNAMTTGNIEPSEYAVHYKAWYNVASIALSHEEIEEIIEIEVEVPTLPSTFGLIMGALEVFREFINNFFTKYVYGK